MNYVYVLTSSPTDTYYEQFFLSVASFRLYNPDAFIVVLIDKNTKNNLVGTRSGYESLVSEVKTIEIPEEFSQKESSRWIKTSIYNYVSGDFLFLDCDTIITDKLEADFDPTIKIGAVLDTHTTLENHHLKNYFQDSDKKLGFNASFAGDKHFNGGLIYCKDDPAGKQFFNKWHELWLYSRRRGNSQDMPPLNQANYELNNVITELPGEWNCQISHNGLPYLHDAKIIHYYATSLTSFAPAYKLASKEVLSSIKETGKISSDIMKMLEKPKAAFEAYSRIIADPVVINAFDGSLFSKLIWLNKNHPGFFKNCDSFMDGFTKFVKKMLGKK
jgi:lipopolysaccharide biosynthesis glycosyltransferase